MVHGCMVYTERAEMAAVSCGTSRCKYTTSVDIQKRAIKKLFTHVESHASGVSLLESGELRYIKAINNNNTPSIAFRHLPPKSARFGYATEGALKKKKKKKNPRSYPPTRSAPSETFGY